MLCCFTVPTPETGLHTMQFWSPVRSVRDLCKGIPDLGLASMCLGPVHVRMETCAPMVQELSLRLCQSHHLFLLKVLIRT